MSLRMRRVAKELVIKSRESALLAVEVFNRPTAEFRVQTFVMLMHVAWNALLLARFHADRIRPFYKDKKGLRYLRVDGEKKAWDLSRCVKEHWEDRAGAVRKNLEFFIGLRNKIEHYRDQSALVMLTFGECQSLVTNYESTLVELFGKKHSLLDGLALSLQLSMLRDNRRQSAIMDAVDASTSRITDFIKDFRSSLTDDIFADTKFSHKLYILPRTVNHQSRDSIAVEWVDLESLTPDQRRRVDKILAIIKQKHVPVRNPGQLRPSDVCERVRSQLGIAVFTPHYHHARCWKHFGVRPSKNSPSPAHCNTEYCQYDEPHRDYLYTEAWVDFLIAELSDTKKREEIMRCEA